MDKTFAAIDKLKEVELELHRLKNALEMMNKAHEVKRKWQGLTDEEIKSAWSQIWYDLGNGKFAASDDPSRHTTVMFARAIEAKLKEKNT